MATIYGLPPEILSHIFDFVAGPAPSERRLHDQPSDAMLNTNPQSQSLKAISLVSKKWRSNVLSLLFRNILWRPDASSLNACRLDPIPLLRFLLDHRLEHYVTTFTMIVNPIHSQGEPGRLPYQIPPAVMDKLWDQLFSVIDPLRFTLISPPTTLAALLNRMLFMDDAWQFDVPYHILSLARSGTTESVGESADVDIAEQLTEPSTSVVSPTSCRNRQPAPRCALFTLRPWTSILLNEGSSIRVYEQYEFFLRSPPSMLGALLGFEEYPNNAPLLPPTITDFNYVAIFPLSSHFSTLARHLPNIDRLFIQLEPRPGNIVLQDQEALRHVDIRDLWMELTSSYNVALRQLFLSERTEAWADEAAPNWDTLKVFEIGDTMRGVSWEMVVDRVHGPGLGRWRTETKGVLVKDGETRRKLNGSVEQHLLSEASLNGQMISVPPPAAIDVPAS